MQESFSSLPLRKHIKLIRSVYAVKFQSRHFPFSPIFLSRHLSLWYLITWDRFLAWLHSQQSMFVIGLTIFSLPGNMQEGLRHLCFWPIPLYIYSFKTFLQLPAKATQSKYLSAQEVPRDLPLYSFHGCWG